MPNLTGALQIFLLSSGKLRPLKGNSKVAASIIIHPNAQISAADEYGFPWRIAHRSYKGRSISRRSNSRGPKAGAPGQATTAAIGTAAALAATDATPVTGHAPCTIQVP